MILHVMRKVIRYELFIILKNIIFKANICVKDNSSVVIFRTKFVPKRYHTHNIIRNHL